VNFGKDLGKFQIDAINATEKTVKGSAIALWKSFIFDAPVKSGRFRGNWFASQTNPVTTTTTFTDKSGTKTAARAATSVLTSSDWQNLWISNNLPYAQVIEYGGYPNPPKLGSWNKSEQRYEINTIGGYSDQAPSGVVRTNVIRFQGILAEEARKN
jgi:hypothetical protein